MLLLFISLQPQMINISLKRLGGLDERKTKPLRKDLNSPWQSFSASAGSQWIGCAQPFLSFSTVGTTRSWKHYLPPRALVLGTKRRERSHGMQNSHKWVNNLDISTMPSRTSILSFKSSIGYIFQSFQALSLWKYKSHWDRKIMLE